jgi:hypothetical protein
MAVTWKGAGYPYKTTWTIKSNHTFTSGSGGYGTWSLNGAKIRVVYKNEMKPVYIGSANPAFSRMSGTASMRDSYYGTLITGTWTAARPLYGAGEDAPPAASLPGVQGAPPGGAKFFE